MIIIKEFATFIKLTVHNCVVCVRERRIVECVVFPRKNKGVTKKSPGFRGKVQKHIKYGLEGKGTNISEPIETARICFI